MQLRKPTLIVLGAGVGFVKSFVKGRIQVTEKPRKGKKTEPTGENIYGGFRYRFSYDDYMRELGQKLQRRQGMGRKAFVVTALVLTGMCAAVLFTAVGYAGQQKQSGRTDSVGIQSALNRTYDTEDLGDMIVESVCPSMTSLYRIPCGVMVTLVNDTVIYQNLVRSIDANAPESIHLCDFPVVETAYIDKKLEEDMEDVLDAVVMGRACRNDAAIKNRQPISRMYIKADFKLDDFYTDIIEDELNVKEVIFTDDIRDFTSYTFKPQLRTVGPKYGKQLGGIQKTLASLDGNTAMDDLNVNGKLTFDVDGVPVELTRDDLLIDMAQKEGYVSQEDNKMTVVLDTNLTEELIEEGFVYEIISKIQTMRKDAGFEVMDHIRVSLNGNEKLAALAQKNAEAISGKVLAEELTSGKNFDVVKEWNVNGEKVVIAVEKIG